MTDEAKAVEIAKEWADGITLANDIIANIGPPHCANDMAQYYLALSERCEKLERVANAARTFINHPDLPEHSELAGAVSELEPGDSDG